MEKVRKKYTKINYFLFAALFCFESRNIFYFKSFHYMYQKITQTILRKMKSCQFDQKFWQVRFSVIYMSSDLNFGDLTYLKLRSLLEDCPVIHLHLNHCITNFKLFHGPCKKSFFISKIGPFCPSCHVAHAMLVHFKDHFAQDKITCSGRQHSFCQSRHFIS